MIIGLIIVAIIVAIAVVASMPGAPSKAPPSLTDLQVPTSEDGREMLVAFGEIVIKDPNVLWDGDLSTTPIVATSGK